MNFNLDKKQKFLLVLVILAFVFIVWQLYSMFGGDLKTANSVAPPAAHLPERQPEQSAKQAQVTREVSPALRPMPQTDQPVPATIEKSGIDSGGSTSDQSQYVQIMNQYQLLKMKRMLLEEEVAIASARQKIAEMNSKTVELGGNVDDSDMGNAGGSGGSVSSGFDGGSMMLGEGGSRTGKVVYVDNQDGQWHATLNYKGEFVEVTVGSELSDGNQVIAIDQSGVILKHGTKLMKLTFAGAQASVEQPPPVQQAQQVQQPEMQFLVKGKYTKKMLQPAVDASSQIQPTDAVSLVMPSKKKTEIIETASLKQVVQKEASKTKIPTKILDTNTKNVEVKTKAIVQESAVSEVKETVNGEAKIKKNVNDAIEPSKIKEHDQNNLKEKNKELDNITKDNAIKKRESSETETKKTEIPSKEVSLKNDKSKVEQLPVSLKTSPPLPPKKEDVHPTAPIQKTPIENPKPIENQKKENDTNAAKLDIKSQLVAESKSKPKSKSETTSSARQSDGFIGKLWRKVSEKISGASGITKVQGKNALAQVSAAPKKIGMDINDLHVSSGAKHASISNVSKVSKVDDAKKPEAAEAHKMEQMLMMLQKKSGTAQSSFLPAVGQNTPEQGIVIGNKNHLVESDYNANTTQEKRQSYPVIMLNDKKANSVIGMDKSMGQEATPKVTGNGTTSKPASLISFEEKGKPNYYSLQLSSDSNEQNVKDFIQENKLGLVAKYVKINDRYVVIYGNYNTVFEAKGAMRGLSESIKKMRPWIRPIYASST